MSVFFKCFMSDSKSTNKNSSVDKLCNMIGDETFARSELINFKTIPCDIKGLAYKYYPVILRSDDPELLDQFGTRISIKGRDLNEDTKLDINYMIKNILLDAIEIGSHPMGYSLGIEPRFINPDEVYNAIDDITAIKNTRFIGFMEAYDNVIVCSTKQQQPLIYNQANCLMNESKVLVDENLELIATLSMRENSDARIFNLLFELKLQKCT